MFTVIQIQERKIHFIQLITLSAVGFDKNTFQCFNATICYSVFLAFSNFMTQVIAVFFEALEATDHKLRREVRVMFVYACCQFILGLMLVVQTFKLENGPAILNRTLCHYLQ